MERYTVEKKIGKGSYGSVYVVRSKSNGQRYVMKRIPITGMTAKEKRAGLIAIYYIFAPPVVHYGLGGKCLLFFSSNHAARQEVSLLQSLQHPNIVAYKDRFVVFFLR